MVLVAAVFFGYAIWARLDNPGANHPQMTIMLPWGLIPIFISFYLFREFNRVKKAKRTERREYMDERRREILNSVLKKKKK